MEPCSAVLGPGGGARLPTCPDSAATACYPGLPPSLSPARLSGAPGMARPRSGAWPLHIPRACPHSLTRAQPRPTGEAPPPPALPLLSEPCPALPPVLELRAHAVGATQARIDIFRERDIFKTKPTISCPLTPQSPHPKEEQSLGGLSGPSAAASPRGGVADGARLAGCVNTRLFPILLSQI